MTVSIGFFQQGWKTRVSILKVVLFPVLATFPFFLLDICVELNYSLFKTELKCEKEVKMNWSVVQQVKRLEKESE